MSGRTALFLLSVLPSLYLPTLSAASPPPPKRVLLLLPVESSRPAVNEILQGLESGLRKSYAGRVTVFVEFTRPPLPADADYGERLFQWISYKYRGQHLDAICPVRPEALVLAEKLRNRLRPTVPIVFGMQKSEYKADFSNRARTTGVLQESGDEETIRAALLMLPETRRVALLGGAAEVDLAEHQRLKELIHRAIPSVDLIPLIGLSLADAASRVSNLPERTIIYLGQFSHDAQGRTVTLAELVATLAPRANSPMFQNSTIPFGFGVVGGPMNSLEQGGEAFGKLVARVLDGTPPESLPIATVPHLRAVDWRELKKWGIPEDRLPPGTEVRFRERNVWEERRGLILAGIGAILLQAFFIGVLLVERRKRFASELGAPSSEDLNRAILSSLRGRIVILDKTGAVVGVRDNWTAADRVEGWFPDAAIGANYAEAWRGCGIEAREHIAAAVDAVMSGREEARVTDYSVRSGEQDRWVEVRVQRLEVPVGRAVVTLVDITQRRRAELDRRRTLEELHHMNRVAAVGQLAGSLAHELAQPLASILTNAQAAGRFADRQDPDLGEIREALSQIAEDDRRAHAIIDRMRTILKKQAIRAEKLDLNRTVDDVSRLVRSVLLMRGIQMRLDLATHGVVVQGDAVALQQVVLNLVNNAMDAVQSLPRGNRLVTVRTAAKDLTGEILVEDNGLGIPTQVADRLFDSFFTTKPDSLGMGLSICRSILESLGGRISAENRADAGAVFRVSLSLVEPAQSQVPSDCHAIGLS